MLSTSSVRFTQLEASSFIGSLTTIIGSNGHHAPADIIRSQTGGFSFCKLVSFYLSPDSLFSINLCMLITFLDPREEPARSYHSAQANTGCCGFPRIVFLDLLLSGLSMLQELRPPVALMLLCVRFATVVTFYNVTLDMGWRLTFARAGLLLDKINSA